MSFIMRPIRFASTGHIIEGSGLFAADSYLSLTPSAGDRDTFTIELIYKLTLEVTHPMIFAVNPSSGQSDTNSFSIQLVGAGTAGYTVRVQGWNGVLLNTTQLLRDPAAWQSLIIACDSTNATADNRVRMYLNGAEVTDFATRNNKTLNEDFGMNGAEVHRIGNYLAGGSGTNVRDYFSRITHVEGLQLDPTSFGEVVEGDFWQINDVSGLTFGDNGWLIEGGSAMSAGTDSSGNSNNFTKSGTITATNDSPTNDAANGYGNYGTNNPLEKLAAGVGTFSNGNLTSTYSSGNNFIHLNTIPVKGGKWYFEASIDAVGSTWIGIVSNTATGGSGALRVDTNPTLDAFDEGYAYKHTGVKGNNGSTASYGDTYTTGEVVGVAVDLDNGTIWFSNEGVWQNSATVGEIEAGTTTNAAYTGLDLTQHFHFACNGYTSMVTTMRFDSSRWTGTAPTGFKSLSTANLPTPSIINPDDHFHSVVVAHDGSSTASTCTFNLDTYEWLAIIKNTTGAVEKWYWIDTLRGVTKILSSDATTAETTDANVMSVSGTTFTLGSTLGAKNYLVEFHKAGLTSAKAANNAGAINATLQSVNPDSKFAISLYTGDSGTGTFAEGSTIAHGLGVTPDMVVVKNRSNAASGSWGTYHVGAFVSAADVNTLYLNTNAVATDDTNVFGTSAAFNATTFTVGNWDGSNENTSLFVSYSWHSVDGYSAFGSYTGNNSADGPMINMGGSPNSWFTKRTDSADTWQLVDVAVPDNDFNIVEERLSINATSIASSTAAMVWDRLSNGWKVRGNDSGFNASGGTYIYGAWGGTPIQGDGAVNQGRAGAVQPYDQAYGGNTIKRVGNFWVHTFTSSGTFTPHKAMDVEYLVIAGGGGGAEQHGGGGGAGGYLTATGMSVLAQEYSITVGAGGAGSAGGSNARGTNGANSVFNGITSTGGGGGGTYISAGGTNAAGAAGGSGGGGSNTSSGSAMAGGAASPSGQGNAGAVGYVGSPNTASGGGGAGAAGTAATGSTTAGVGGDGLSSSITGTAIFRAGGGGGGAYENYTPAAGGNGGGGAGSANGTVGAPVAGTANTGGGGGGGSSGTGGEFGGNGGSGVVIIKYAIG